MAALVGTRLRVPRDVFAGWLRAHPEEEPPDRAAYDTKVTGHRPRGGKACTMLLDFTGETFDCSASDVAMWTPDFDDELTAPTPRLGQLALLPPGYVAIYMS